MIYMFVKNYVNILHIFFYDLVVISSAIWIVDVSVFYEKTERDVKKTLKKIITELNQLYMWTFYNQILLGCWKTFTARGIIFNYSFIFYSTERALINVIFIFYTAERAVINVFAIFYTNERAAISAIFVFLIFYTIKRTAN